MFIFAFCFAVTKKINQNKYSTGLRKNSLAFLTSQASFINFLSFQESKNGYRCTEKQSVLVAELQTDIEEFQMLFLFFRIQVICLALKRLLGMAINKSIRNYISVILKNTRQIIMSNRGNVDLYSKFCSSAERINSTEKGLNFVLIGCKCVY